LDVFKLVDIEVVGNAFVLWAPHDHLLYFFDDEGTDEIVVIGYLESNEEYLFLLNEIVDVQSVCAGENGK
jgi:hypothetical protein